MRKMLGRIAILTLAITAGGATAGAAQSSRWSAEGRLNVTVPTGDLSDMQAESGLGVGADVFYTFIPNMSAFAGLSRHAFNCTGCPDITSTGLDAGVKFVFGSTRRAMPWARGGIMLHKADFGDVESDRTLGAEIGAGIDLRVADRLYIVPALRFHTYPADLPGGSEVDMKYLTIGLGGHVHF